MTSTLETPTTRDLMNKAFIAGYIEASYVEELFGLDESETELRAYEAFLQWEVDQREEPCNAERI
jgi:hypothetical protein